MAVTNNNKAVIDLPGWEVLQPLPAASAVGVCMCNDRRGTSRYIYLLIGATSFWRYDVQANTYQQLANPPAGTLGAGTCLSYDPSRGYVWALISNGTVAPTWQYYNTATNAWTARAVTNLPATFGTDSSICHTCTTYDVGGNDDYLYLIGNNATPWYRYSVVGNSWTVMANAVTAAPGAGCAIHWLPTYSTDKLVIIRGGATATVYEYTIGVPAWATKTIVPATETFTTGTMSCPRWLTDNIIIQHNVTMRIHTLDMGDLTVTPLCTEYLLATGATHVGDRLLYVIETNGIAWVYFGLHTSANFLRSALIF